MNRHGEFLRAKQQADLTEDVKRERQPLVATRCAWCHNVARAIPVIPRPSLEMCKPHTDLAHEWSMRLRRLPIRINNGLEELRAEIIERGVAIANAASADLPPLSMDNLVTPRQLNAIRCIGRDAGLPYKGLCVEAFGCRPDELSRRAASELIERLKAEAERASRPINSGAA